MFDQNVPARDALVNGNASGRDIRLNRGVKGLVNGVDPTGSHRWNCRSDRPGTTVTLGGVGDDWGGYLQFQTGRNCGLTGAGLFYLDDHDRHHHHGHGYYYPYYSYYPAYYYPYYSYYWPYWWGPSHTTYVYYHDSYPYDDYGSTTYYEVDRGAAVPPTYESYEPTDAAEADADAAQPSGGATYRPIPDAKAIELVKQGDAAFSDGRYDEAERLYVRAVMADERDGYAKFMYAMTQFAVGDYDVAAPALRRAILTAPSLIDDPPDLLRLYPDALRFEAQRSNLLRYTERNPGDFDAVVLMGYIELTGRAYDNAEAIFGELTNHRPDDQVVSLLRDSANRLKAFHGANR